MHAPVQEAYPELWHYTTASGLHGILTSQELWATNILFLNDKEEFRGFFDQKLKNLILDGVRNATVECNKTENGKLALANKNGEDFLAGKWAEAQWIGISQVTLSYPAYVTSFCYSPPDIGNDGLLSQWRGYGTDGGYALVFDTAELSRLIEYERNTFHYTIVHWGDVDYLNEDPHKEAVEWEDVIRQGVSEVIQMPGSDLFIPEHIGEKLLEPIFCLATRHKHRGFREEREVRIVVVGMQNEVIEEAVRRGDLREKKTVNFVPRKGKLVPYVALFDHLKRDGTGKLPIKRIVVGPHPEKERRKQSVEMMLAQLGYPAEVVTSDIPYIGS